MGVIGHVDLIRSEQTDHTHLEEYTDNIMKSAERMTALTKQMLAYARGGKYAPRFACLNDFVREAFVAIRYSLPPVVKIATELQDDAAMVEIDGSQFQFVLNALLSNACEAMENIGRIWIRTRNIAVDEKMARQYAGLIPGLYACLQMEDNGPGMDDKTRQKIFEPFFSTKFPGRGMGMAAIYGIVKNHNGWIGVDTEPGSGTLVSIFFPGLSRTG
jgi:signal transduction histidine kinase